MTVHFIGAGPGAPDLITLRGRDLLAACPVCLYAGSTVAPALLAHCRPDATRIDTAPLTLDDIERHCLTAHRKGQDVARLHSGDLSAHSAVAEQRARLHAHGIPTTMTPGVSALGACASLLETELTRPGLAQSVVLTRLSGRATPVPDTESLETFARTGATLALHLSVHRLPEIVARLAPILGPDCPIAIVERATWPDQRLWRATLATIETALGGAPPPRLALILIGRTLDPDAETATESRLYAPDYDRHHRPAAEAPPR